LLYPWHETARSSGAACHPPPRRRWICWLPGLAAIATGITPIVGDGSRPLFRHIGLSPALRSAAILLDNRLELRVAPADHAFALALVAAFVAPAGRRRRMRQAMTCLRSRRGSRPKMFPS
jgi:hypothetical protein